MSDPVTRVPSLVCLLGAVGAIAASSLLITSSVSGDGAGGMAVFALLVLIGCSAVTVFGAVRLVQRSKR